MAIARWVWNSHDVICVKGLEVKLFRISMRNLVFYLIHYDLVQTLKGVGKLATVPW